LEGRREVGERTLGHERGGTPGLRFDSCNLWISMSSHKGREGREREEAGVGICSCAHVCVCACVRTCNPPGFRV